MLSSKEDGVLSQALTDVAKFALPESLDGLKQHLDPAWIEEALASTGTTTIRRRRLPAEQIVWLVIGMALYRREPIQRVVEVLDLALPDRKDTLMAKSAIIQARKRLPKDTLAYLFSATAAEWSARSADAHRWRGLALYGWDGTTMRVPDSPENRAEFGGQSSHRGDSGYPQVRVVAAMALRSHVLSAFRFADYHTGETTLARDLWDEIPDNSLVIFDRNFLVKKDFIRFETAGNKHWLSRSKSNTRWASIERLGKDDELVVLEVDEPGYPTTWELRAIHYKRKGFPRATLLTSLLDPVQYPAKELVALYHERWETELGYDEVKTHLLDREEAIRSRTPEGVRQELWGIAIAYNLIRLEMERAATEAKVPPTRISFMAAMALIKDEIGRLRGAGLPLGTIPNRLKELRKNLKRLVLPERRSERAYPRAVKIKMSSYPRKRPKPRRSPTGGRAK
jgi:Insertion element 4 transposase N-terminal/Transposase DDE domain